MPDDSSVPAKLLALNKTITDLQAKLVDLQAKLLALNTTITDLKAKNVDLQNQIINAQAKVHFGDWVQGYDINKEYTATTDGFVCVTVSLPDSATDHTYVEGTSYPPDHPNRQVNISFLVNPGQWGTMTMPVRAGDIWRVVPSYASILKPYVNILWIPLTT
jgi:hypothetical protein